MNKQKFFVETERVKPGWMKKELFPLVKEVGKHVLYAAADSLMDKRVRGENVISNMYGIDFALEDLKVDHGAPKPLKPLPKPSITSDGTKRDIKKDGAILEELGARLYVLELENGPTTHHGGNLYCD